jgi:recombinational DNA repair protein (RecF pathway)
MWYHCFMVEHYTRAVVLTREPKGELDVSLILYTKDFGKIVAKVKSVRRFTSKLSGHLTPGSFVKMRIVERNGNGHQVVDALSSKVQVTLELLKFLDFVGRITPLNMPDLYLWHELQSAVQSGHVGRPLYHRVISLMGYDVSGASCANCGSLNIGYFLPSDIIFLCNSCFEDSGAKEDESFSI